MWQWLNNGGIIFASYVCWHSGRAEEIVTELGDNPAKVAEYTTTQAIQQLAEKSPELLPQRKNAHWEICISLDYL